MNLSKPSNRITEEDVQEMRSEEQRLKDVAWWRNFGRKVNKVSQRLEEVEQELRYTGPSLSRSERLEEQHITEVLPAGRGGNRVSEQQEYGYEMTDSSVDEKVRLEYAKAVRDAARSKDDPSQSASPLLALLRKANKSFEDFKQNVKSAKEFFTQQRTPEAEWLRNNVGEKSESLSRLFSNRRPQTLSEMAGDRPLSKPY